MIPKSPVNCDNVLENFQCRENLALSALKPVMPTIDMVDPNPTKMQLLFSGNSWANLWGKKFGQTGWAIGRLLFNILDKYDNRPMDKFLDIAGIPKDRIDEAFEFINAHIKTDDENEAEVLNQIRDELKKYRNNCVKTYTLIKFRKMFVAMNDEQKNIVSFSSPALTKAWEEFGKKYPISTMRAVTDCQTFSGRPKDDLNPERNGLFAPFSYNAQPFLTGGIGSFSPGENLLIFPYTNKTENDPNAIGSGIMFTTTLLFIIVVLLGGSNKRPPVMTPVPEQGPTPNRPVSLRLPPEVTEALKDQRGNRPTIYFMQGRPNAENGGTAMNVRTQSIRRLETNPTFIKNNFANTSNYKQAGWTLDRFFFKPSIWFQTNFGSPNMRLIADHVNQCVKAPNNSWNPANAYKFLRFVGRNGWLQNMLAKGLKNIQSGTQEGSSVGTAGEVIPRVRVDKPWGWELILTTVREKTGEGYTEKYLIITGPLSNQLHETYMENGQPRSAKVETQTSYGPSPYLLRVGGGTNQEEVYEIKPGEIFHIAGGVWHQPGVRPGDIAIVKETSKPNIGPGSTTRDPNGDPWKNFRTTADK